MLDEHKGYGCIQQEGTNAYVGMHGSLSNDSEDWNMPQVIMLSQQLSGLTRENSCLLINARV